MSGGSGTDPLFGVFFVVALIAFFVLREVWCWYWKVNKVVALLESIDRTLKMLPAEGQRGDN
jgi:hypothetical protein